MTDHRPEPVPITSADVLADALSALRELIPQAFTEGKVDVARLRELLGDAVDDRPERYSFTRAGKRDAIRILQTPSRATLKPDRFTDDDKEQSFLICPDDSFDLATARDLNPGRDDLFICRNAALDDALGANLALQCRLKTL